MQKKLVMLFVAFILAFVVLIGRITYINASIASVYKKFVLYQLAYHCRVIPYKRGDIVDRNGTKMATSERVYNVILDVYVMLSDEKYEDPTMEVLEDCFGIPEEEVEKVIEERPESRYEILKTNVPYETKKKFDEIEQDEKNYAIVQGIWLEEDY